MKTKRPRSSLFMLGSQKLEQDYLDHNINRYLHTLKYLKEKFNKASPISILDIGTSPFTFLLKKEFPNAKIFTLDYSDVFKDRCKNNNIVFIKDDISSKKIQIFKNKFDVITFLETLEHIKGSHQFVIKKITNNLKNSGICIIQTPNINSLKSILLKLISIKFWTSGSTFTVIEGEFVHVKEYSQAELEKLISSVPKTKIVSSKLQDYYEHPSSSLVYRKNKLLYTPIAYLYYFVTQILPDLRIGLEIIFTKI